MSKGPQITVNLGGIPLMLSVLLGVAKVHGDLNISWFLVALPVTLPLMIFGGVLVGFVLLSLLSFLLNIRKY